MPVLYTRRLFHSICGSLLAASPLLSAAPEVITAPLEDWTKYPELRKYAAAFEFLKATSFKGKEPERFELDGKRMYATLSVSKAKSPDEGRIEAHRQYLDIHYLVEGSEMIGSSPITGLELSDAYKAANDVEFYKRPANYRKIQLRPGQFAVFMPGQGHMPGCGTDTSTMIRKVVVKSLV